MAEDANGRYSIRAVERVCDILDLMRAAERGVTLTDVAAAGGMPKSTAFRYLSALERRNYVEKSAGTGLFRLGLAFYPESSLERAALVRAAEPVLHRVRDEVGETVNLGIFDAGQVVHALVVESLQPMRLAARVGDRGPIHSTALGKIMSTELPEEQIRAILAAQGMPAYTSSTITTPTAFLAEVERVREVGYGLDDSENQTGGRCVAVLIPDLRFLAGISVSAPATQLPMAQLPEVITTLRAAAREIRAQLDI